MCLHELLLLRFNSIILIRIDNEKNVRLMEFKCNIINGKLSSLELYHKFNFIDNNEQDHINQMAF